MLATRYVYKSSVLMNTANYEDLVKNKSFVQFLSINNKKWYA